MPKFLGLSFGLNLLPLLSINRCTVVGNPGGPWGFGQILSRGYLGLSENLGGEGTFLSFLCFIAFLCDNFSDSQQRS
jgi:hypothetical protein